MKKINRSSKMAYCVCDDGMIAMGSWVSGNDVKELTDAINEEFLYGTISSEFELDDAYDDINEMKVVIDASDDVEENRMTFKKIRSLLEKTKDAKDIHELNKTYLEMVSHLSDLRGSSIMITCFDDPYDAVGLLSSHDGYGGSMTIASLCEDFKNDIQC